MLFRSDNYLLNERAAVSALLATRENCSNSELPFPITGGRFWQIYRKYARAIGLPGAKQHPHCLKHTIAKHLIRAGVPIDIVVAWIGWRSFEMAKVYMVPDEEELGESVGMAIRAKMGLR